MVLLEPGRVLISARDQSVSQVVAATETRWQAQNFSSFHFIVDFDLIRQPLEQRIL